MIIDCVSDLHGFFPKLEGGDLLIVAGDLTARDTQEELDKFDSWLCHQPYKKKIFIAGNHDNLLVDEKARKYREGNNNGWHERCEYLCDSGTEFEGLKIWGSPWTKSFSGMNPKCMAFTCETNEELAEKWALIPKDIDILVTHSPPYGKLDKTNTGHCGSKSLDEQVKKIRPALHFFGHIHEGYWEYGGTLVDGGPIVQYFNCSHVNERYEPVNNPIRIELSGNSG